MKHHITKRILSLMLAMVMFVSLLPTAAISVTAETTYTKAGEVGAVTAECEAFTVPSLGAQKAEDFNFTVTSPTDQGVSIYSGDGAYWEILSDGIWEKYTETAFDEGTYRLHLTLKSSLLSDGTYYALSSATTLTLNGVSFNAGLLYDDYYETEGQGSLIFYSPEYTVTRDADTYLIAVTADINGKASADKVYGKTGEVVTLTAQPYTGYRLKEWQVISGGVAVVDNQFTIGSEDVEIKAIFESTNENLGDIEEITASFTNNNSYADLRPVMGREAIAPTIEFISSEPQDDTFSLLQYETYWEVKQSDGSWEKFKGNFTYGTYRFRIRMQNRVVDGKYYALTYDTVLGGETLSGWLEFTAYSLIDYFYSSPENGHGIITFVSPEMDVVPSLDVYDGTYAGCHVVPTLGEFTVPLGDNFSFTVEPDDYYELTDPDALEIYVNETLVTPDEDGVYTVSTEDAHGVDIYAEGDAFTGYSNLVVSANGTTKIEKLYVGDTYTFKTLAEFGATVPEGSSFTGWKIGGTTYQPGETYTVADTTEIKVEAAFAGLYNITVENGKAYADAAHTIPISAAAENQVIYVVADPAPEGKVFSYWNRTFAVVGGHGWFGDSEAAVTTFTVYDSDVVLTPVYETQIDNIVINGMTKPSAGVAIDNSDYSYKWGCSVPADSGYSLGINYWYDITDGEPEQAMSDGDVFQLGHTYRFKAKISLYGDTVLAAKEDISVTLNGIDAEDYEWTISEYSQIYDNMVIYFEFTCEREEPDTALICPKGDGTSGNPFQITNIGELYWFAAFVNGTASYPDGVTVERKKACAILMNDITVNPGVLTEDGELNGTSGFAQWTPIGYNSNYSGTFDGQEHTISGIYYAPQAAADYRYGGFFRSLNAGGSVCNLTLSDSYFCAPAKNSAYTGAFVGYISSGCTVENCHFDGTVTTAITADSSDEDKETYQYVRIAGIAGDVNGEIRKCTVRGLISGYGSEIGGFAAYVTNGKVIGCVNEATVETPEWCDIGGIVGRMVYSGIIRDCCNKGKVIGWSSAGIVSNVESKGGEVIRCWNEGDIEGPYGSGIVLSLMGSVKNCYNAGSAAYAGIVGTSYSGSSIAYCHNVGEITGLRGTPIGNVSSGGSNITIANCYYLADSELDELDGTTYKTATEFADGTVLALLDSGHWTQGEDDAYPVLADIKGDVNEDGTVDISDATTLYNALMGKTTLDDSQKLIADVNSDGSINILDVMMVLSLI